MHRKVGRRAWELAHKSMHYGLTVYGDAVHEEEARRADSEWCREIQKMRFEFGEVEQECIIYYF